MSYGEIACICTHARAHPLFTLNALCYQNAWNVAVLATPLEPNAGFVVNAHVLVKVPNDSSAKEAVGRHQCRFPRTHACTSCIFLRNTA